MVPLIYILMDLDENHLNNNKKRISFFLLDHPLFDMLFLINQYESIHLHNIDEELMVLLLLLVLKKKKHYL